MKILRVIIPAVLLLIMALGFPVPPPEIEAQQFGTGWIAQYFNNDSLSGSPVLARVEQQVNFNYGTGSPDAAFVPADNFSARFTGLEEFATGIYRFYVQADDGARVFLDGNLVIDVFGNTGGVVVAFQDVNISQGTHEITIEYVERSGNALVQFFWEALAVVPTFTPGPTPTPTNTGPPPIPPGALTATVIRASVLNVRDAPSLGGRVVGRILRGQTYQVVGRNTDATWFLLQLSQFQAWVYGYYLFVNGNEFTAPIRSATTLYGIPPGFQNTGVIAQTQAVMKMRASPDIFAEQTGRIGWGEFLPVTGRTAAGDWYQVLWKGTIGWVYTGFLEIIQGDLGNVPVVQ